MLCGELPITLWHTPFVAQSTPIAMVKICASMHPTFHTLARSKRHLISGIAIMPYLFRNSANITTMTPQTRCPISQSSMTSVMSMFNCISTKLCYDQISHPRRVLQANFQSHIVVRDICYIHIQLQSSMTSVMSLFSYTLPFPRYYPISDFIHPSCHLWCECSISSWTLFPRHQSSHLRSVLLTNFWSHTVVCDTCDIHV